MASRAELSRSVHIQCRCALQTNDPHSGLLLGSGCQRNLQAEKEVIAILILVDNYSVDNRRSLGYACTIISCPNHIEII